MTIQERTQVATSIAVITLCLVVAACFVTTTHSVNHALIVAEADLHTSALRVPDAVNQFQSTTRAAGDLLRAATPVVAGLRGTEGRLNDAIELTSHRLNDLCSSPEAVDASIRPCGTLADTNRTLATFRGTAGQFEVSMRHFNQHSDELFAQEHDAYGQMSKSLTDIDLLVGDPDLRAIIANGRSVSGDAAGMTADGRFWLHQKLFPTKKKGLLSGFEATGDVAKHWMPSLF